MACLSLGNPFPHGAGHVLDGHIGIDSALVKQVDHIAAEPLVAFLVDTSDLIGVTVEPS